MQDNCCKTDQLLQPVAQFYRQLPPDSYIGFWFTTIAIAF